MNALKRMNALERMNGLGSLHIFLLGNKNNNSIIWRATHFLTRFLWHVAELAEIKIIR
jgi:hypothetical protein